MVQFKAMHRHLVIMSDAQYHIITEALEAHGEGLKESTEHVTVDPTITSIDDLTDVTRTISEDVETIESLKEVFHD